MTIVHFLQEETERVERVERKLREREKENEFE